MVEKKYEQLYERIKDYDISSLRVELCYQLESNKKLQPNKQSSNQNRTRGIHHLINLKHTLLNLEKTLLYLTKTKRITLEESMSKKPELTNALLSGISESIIEYGCSI